MFDFWTANVFDAKDVLLLALGGAIGREIFGRFFAKRRKVKADSEEQMENWECLLCKEKGKTTKFACNDREILMGLLHDHMEYFHPGQGPYIGGEIPINPK